MDTDLEQVLADLGVGRLVVTGAQTDACIRAALHGAFVRGYDTDLVQVVAHTNLYWRFQSGPGREASVVEGAEAAF